jgi:hypothetical protein
MLVVYRKRKGSDGDWHFHWACIHWPEDNYIEKPFPPVRASLCPKCALLYNVPLEH